MQVAEAYYDFLMRAPCYPPREAVAGSPRPLVITPNGPFALDNLALTLLTHVDRGVFEALVEYIPPPPVVGYYIPGLLLDLPQQVYSSCCPVVATPHLNVPDAYTLHNHPAMLGPHSVLSHAQHSHQGASSSRPQSVLIAEGEGRLGPAQW
ncbi:hypothetical protein K466DRAFT_271315 [Polyporus arcularius HHB13444]|uniref:Uncharacterized protein n=1 Tax=Polyporus arcularius HHB13444 TaxID=1314778 RepID=A0A5C3P0L2_9APHY|nr:hypothetical protein K466DRAFT_271315 [Polyporus arcularius HHB13444]